MNKYIKIVLGVVVIGIIAIIGILFQKDATFGGGAGQTAYSCSVTSTIATVGKDILTGNILATSSRRAWARIQVPQNATNTIFLSFDEGAQAVLNQGMALNTANLSGASSTPFIEFGLNTSFPYTGTVKGLSNNGSSTVLTTECVY